MARDVINCVKRERGTKEVGIAAGHVVISG